MPFNPRDLYYRGYKNNNNNNNFILQPIPLETLGLEMLAPSALDFLGELDQWLSAATCGGRETAVLFQRLSVVIQRYNSVLIRESFGDLDLQPDL